MKREINRIRIFVLFLFLSLCFFFSMKSVSAEVVSLPSKDVISSLFNFQNLELVIAKGILMVVFMVLIALALDFAKFPPQKIVRAFIAILVGFLITVYLVPEEMFIILPSDIKKFYTFLSNTKLFGMVDMRIVAVVGLIIIIIMWSQASKQMKMAKEILGKKFFGPEQIEKVFGAHLESEDVPDIPFSKNDLETAKKLGQTLILRIDELEGAPFLTPDHLDVKLDFESVALAGSMLGSGGVTVMEEGTDMVWAALRLMEFFYHESCGKCSPCREGSSWLVQIMRRIVNKRGRMEDLETLTDLCKNIAGRTVCAFGDAEVSPILSTLKHWRHEYVTMIHAAEAANLIRPEPAGAKH